MSEMVSLENIERTASRLSAFINQTPTHLWKGREINALVGDDTDIFIKLELLQHSGTFKARGALSNILNMTDDERARGVTAASAGNHAIATAFAASIVQSPAKVVMQSSANPYRVAAAKAYGAEVIMAKDGPEAFRMAEEIASVEGKTFIHPFDGLQTALGTATLGREFLDQTGPLDVIVVPIGGGGLCGGVAAAVKLIHPGCVVVGVEPECADSMHQSFAAGSAQTISSVNTIADSLGPPMAMPFTYAQCKAHVDRLVTVSDDQLKSVMALIFRELKFAVEPACAASTAAYLWHLRKEFKGKRVGLIFCGTNIDRESFTMLTSEGEAIALPRALD